MILVVVVIFWKCLWLLVGIGKVIDGLLLNLLYIIIGMIFVGVFGVLFYSIIKEGLFGLGLVVISLVVGGILMIVVEKFLKLSIVRMLDEIIYK